MESSNMLIMINIRECGGMVKETEMGSMSTQMAIFMMDSGSMIWNKGKENLRWQLGINIKDNGLQAKRMVWVSTFLQMEIFMKVSSITETDKDKGATHGQIRAITEDNG